MLRADGVHHEPQPVKGGRDGRDHQPPPLPPHQAGDGNTQRDGRPEARACQREQEQGAGGEVPAQSLSVEYQQDRKQRDERDVPAVVERSQQYLPGRPEHQQWKARRHGERRAEATPHQLENEADADEVQGDRGRLVGPVALEADRRPERLVDEDDDRKQVVVVRA
jgi:hypothetical protein